jgi:transglutaminase-like putative cysteine protease
MVVGTPAVAAYAATSFPTDRPLGEAVGDLVARIHRDFDYKPGVTTIATPVSEVFERRRGVCQDFAHLGLAALRAMGLAARYVSGYLETTPPPGTERLVGADASHAWLAVYDPDAGWIDFDPTNDQPVGERYVTTAWGRLRRRDADEGHHLRRWHEAHGDGRGRCGADGARLRAAAAAAQLVRQLVIQWSCRARDATLATVDVTPLRRNSLVRMRRA